MVLSVPATVVLEITKNCDVADSLNETNVIFYTGLVRLMFTVFWTINTALWN